MSGKNGACNVLTKLFVMSCSSEWLMLQPYYLFGPSHLFWFAWNSWWNLEFTFPWPFLHLFRPFHLLYCWNSCWKLEFNCNFSRFFFFILFEMPQSISIWHNNWNSKEYWISDYVKAKSYLINSFKNNLFDGRNSWSFVRRQIVSSKSTSKNSSKILSNHNKHFPFWLQDKTWIKMPKWPFF